MRLRAALANGADAPHALKVMSSKNSARRRRLLGTGGSLRSRLLHECRARDGSSPKDSSVLVEVQDALWEGRTVAGGWWDGGGWGWACRCPRALLSKAEAATSRQDTSALLRCSSQRGHGQTQAASRSRWNVNSRECGYEACYTTANIPISNTGFLYKTRIVCLIHFFTPPVVHCLVTGEAFDVFEHGCTASV